MFWLSLSSFIGSVIPVDEVVAKLVVITLSAVKPKVLKNIFLHTYTLFPGLAFLCFGFPVTDDSVGVEPSDSFTLTSGSVTFAVIGSQ